MNQAIFKDTAGKQHKDYFGQKKCSEVQVMVAYLLGCFGSLRDVWMKQMKNYYLLLLLILSYTVSNVWISSITVVHTHLFVWVSLPGLIPEYLVRSRWSRRPPPGSVQRGRETKGCDQDSMWQPWTPTHPHPYKSLSKIRINDWCIRVIGGFTPSSNPHVQIIFTSQHI